MFTLLSKLVCTLVAFLFPAFASYKALKANDPTQLTPWLMYWVVMACFLVVENFVGPLVSWLPLYSEARALFLLWLVLPQTQGAKYLYVDYVHPTLLRHENEIDDAISKTHEHVKANGVRYIKQLIAFIKGLLLGETGKEQGQAAERPPSPASQTSYTQSLLSRFKVPPIGESTDFFNLLFSPIGDGTDPRDIKDRIERRTFIETQRARLTQMLHGLDEAEKEDVAQRSGPTLQDMVKDVLGDQEFENVPKETPSADVPSAAKPDAKGGWWFWGAGSTKGYANVPSDEPE